MLFVVSADLALEVVLAVLSLFMLLQVYNFTETLPKKKEKAGNYLLLSFFVLSTSFLFDTLDEFFISDTMHLVFDMLGELSLFGFLILFLLTLQKYFRGKND